ncbi:TetR/AcrR family transcriptional regulator [Peteryoungia ipomoeae]|uniref:TetR/AcrR family transcriptional regulator n=1 Tax=Peteryoungia ipomoeae TaxID=1210932 RepID=A0A4S8NZX2_9HYPH|nr:TetR/AcrR family transcriptional regulator [Peteryoungia ipomoeae]THV23320.1 TetR/AcrR family transcriptional regulator [Peteryoungia ipomoeae]
MNEQIVHRRLQQRKKPRQERSIQRLEAIIEASIALFLEKGVNEVTMSEIAQRAGIPIGSLYQFFPQKAAVIKALHDRLAMQIDAYILRIFAGITTLDAASARAADCLFELHDLFRKEPIYTVLWQAIITDKDLRFLSAGFHERLIAAFYQDLSHLLTEVPRERFNVNLKLMIVSTSEVFRMTSHLGEDEARVHLSRWREIIRLSIFDFSD